nr:hypothetical protein [Tanacetum cinerariifolium]
PTRKGWLTEETCGWTICGISEPSMLIRLWLVATLFSSYFKKGLPLFFPNGERHTASWSEVDQERHEQILELQSLVGSNVAVESIRLLKEFQYNDLESTRGMMRLICETQLKVQLPVVLECGNVFQKKGIYPSKYTITFRLADNVPKHGAYMVIMDINSKLKSHEKLKIDAASMTFDEVVAWEKEESLSPLQRTPPLKPIKMGIQFPVKNLYAKFLLANCADDHFDPLDYWKYKDVYGGGCFDVGGSFKGFDWIDEPVGSDDRSLPGKSKDEFSNDVILDDVVSSLATTLSLLLKMKGKIRVTFTRMRAIIKKSKMISLRKSVRSNYGRLVTVIGLNEDVETSSMNNDSRVDVSSLGGLEVRLKIDDETSSNDDTYSNDDKSLNYDTSSSEDLINYLSTRDIQWQLPKNTQAEQPKPLHVPIKTEEAEPLPLPIVYPYSHFALNTLPGASSDEMYMEEEEVVFKIHTKGYFEYDPLMYVNGSINCVSAFTRDKDVFPRCLNHIMSEEEDDTGLRCCSSTPFDTRFKRKINKSKKICVIHDDGAGRKREKSLVNGGNKGKEKLFEDEGVDKKRKKTLVTGGSKGKEKVFEDECMCRNGNEGVVTIYKRVMVNRKAKMVEVLGVVKTRRDIGVVIGGKEEVVSKRGIGSRRMHGTIVKVKSE